MFFHMIFNFDFTPLFETDSKGLFFKKWFLSVGLLGGFTPLILMELSFILILHGGKYHFN